MIIDKFTFKAQDAIERASRLTVKHEHQYVTPWHLTLGLLQQDGGVAGRLLEGAGVDIEKLQIKVEGSLAATPKGQADMQQTPISRETEKVLVDAEEAAQALEAKTININHLLLGLLEHEAMMGAFGEAGGDKAQMKQALEQAPKGGYKAGEAAPGEFEYLERFGRDLTEVAREGEMDPIIGREHEIKLTIEILSRRMKNNPIIIGEPGVGKTAIVEGLAQRIAAGNVPDDLKDQTVLALDIGQLVAGARYRGEFEERLKQVMEEVKAAGNITLFIDEIHMIIGAGGAEGSMDAANLIKPALSRGEIRVMGATTLEEYRKHIEKDAALMRRFQIVTVDEPSDEETLNMLRGVKEKYDVHHGVRLLDEALLAAVKLSKRYITDRFLPDKAIDLIDQTAATVRLRLAAKPEAIEALDQRIVTLAIELKALTGEDTPAAADRRGGLEAELEKLRGESAELTAKWEHEKNAIGAVQEAKKTLAEAKREMEQKVREEDFARVAELQYKVIPAAEKTLEAFADVDLTDSRLLKEYIDEEDVAATVSRLTGIPVAKMVGAESEQLLDLESLLRRRVVGQEEALNTVAKAVRRARAGVQNPGRPLGSFLILGPTGVGKTELAKALAEFLFNDERALLRIDMSEFMEKHSAARLIGAPPGYVGYEEGGILTNKVRRKPYTAILFDEVEKAHPDVFNLFLQLLDDGRLTDSSGQTISFANTIVLMTSNLGSEHIEPVETEEEQQQMNAGIMAAVRGHFRPEFLNRLDDILVFKQLTLEVMKPIVDIQLSRLERLLDDRKMGLEVDQEARELLAEAGFNPAYGARPLQRVIQTRLQDPLAEEIIQGNIAEGSTVTVSVVDGELSITGSAPASADSPAADE